MIIQSSSSANTIYKVANPLKIKTMPPDKSKYFSLTRPLIHYPSWTAPNVQIKWPRTEPKITIITLKEAAKAIVAICDLSPH